MPLWFTLDRKTVSVSLVAVAEKSPGHTKTPRDPANKVTGRSKRLENRPNSVRNLPVNRS
jgi:hypothetical protein